MLIYYIKLDHALYSINYGIHYAIGFCIYMYMYIYLHIVYRAYANKTHDVISTRNFAF